MSLTWKPCLGLSSVNHKGFSFWFVQSQIDTLWKDLQMVKMTGNRNVVKFIWNDVMCTVCVHTHTCTALLHLRQRQEGADNATDLFFTLSTKHYWQSGFMLHLIYPFLLYSCHTHLSFLSSKGHKMFCVFWKCHSGDTSLWVAVEQCMNGNAGIFYVCGYNQEQRWWQEHINTKRKAKATQSKSPISPPCCLAPGLLLQSSACPHSHIYMRSPGSDPEKCKVGYLMDTACYC